MISVVISQPMLFPWVGMFEQIKLADQYVHYTDVQFSKGSFVNRVQIMTAAGIKWLTVPLKGLSLGQHINAVEINDSSDWRSKHVQMLRQAYIEAPYGEEMLAIVEEVYATRAKTIDEIAISSLEVVAEYFGLNGNTQFFDSSEMNIGGSSSQRVLDIVLTLGGRVYITGHGAKNYLDHELFENNGVRVEYMDYKKTPYTQSSDEFTPYVSILDLIANLGPAGKKCISSGAKYWKDYI